ncbi:MAG: metallophosphoesterase, partial [Verrucomicrobia bacterium]|nr:metallophosphoesterase [Verrucomicrobiota bacterium]
RIVQISDLHLTAHRGASLVPRVLDAVQSLAPDILVSTGDLVDSPFEAVRGYAVALRGLSPPGGRFAVLGNHEYYTGLKQALAFHEAAGFTLLRGDLIEAAPGLWLAGVDDPAGSYTRQPHFEDERALAAARPADGFVLLLKHQPLVSREAGAWFDLQLSGHTHGGQLFPFGWFLKPIYPWCRGLHKLAPGRWLYVNRGAGTWGPPMRLLARPEITLIILESKRVL